MTTQDKANQLVATAELIILAEVGFKLTPTERNSIAKRYAINCCDELLNDTKDVIDYHRYWEQVKQEIEKL